MHPYSPPRPHSLHGSILRWIQCFLLLIPLIIPTGLILAALMIAVFQGLSEEVSVAVNFHLSYESPIMVYGWLGWRLVTTNLLFTIVCVMVTAAALPSIVFLRWYQVPDWLVMVSIVSWCLSVLGLLIFWSVSPWMSI